MKIEIALLLLDYIEDRMTKYLEIFIFILNFMLFRGTSIQKYNSPNPLYIPNFQNKFSADFMHKT